MSTFTVPIGISAQEGGPIEELEAVVDTGAFYCWIPRDKLEHLGIRPQDTRKFTLATGKEAVEQIGYAWIRINGQSGPTIVVFAREGSEPLLGAYTLEGFAIAADLVNERLVPMPKLRAYRASQTSEGGTA